MTAIWRMSSPFRARLPRRSQISSRPKSPRAKRRRSRKRRQRILAYDLYLRAKALFADTSDPIHAREKLPKRPNYSMKLSPATRTSYRLGVCCPEYTALLTLGATTTPRPVSIWLMRPCKPRCAFSRMRRSPSRAGYLLLQRFPRLRARPQRAGNRPAHTAQQRRSIPNTPASSTVAKAIGEATRNLERALELDPRNFFTLQQLALTYQWQRRYADQART